MFKKLRDFFKGDSDDGGSGKGHSAPVRLEADKSGKPTDHDLHIATVVLLIEMASSDQDIAREEAETVCNLMQAQFGIDDAKIPEIVEVAISSRKAKGKINEFVALINERFTDAQRQVILAMIWKIVIADGKIEQYEQNFANQMRNRLRLTEEIAEEARAMAEDDRI